MNRETFREYRDGLLFFAVVFALIAALLSFGVRP